MLKRFKLFHEGGLKKGFGVAKWRKARDALRTDIMTLPPDVTRASSRKTIDVGERICLFNCLRKSAKPSGRQEENRH